MQQRQARLAGIVGNVVEWYDFALFAYLAATIGILFFAAENPTASLLASFGVFAAGFVTRPHGAEIFCWLGNTIGRRRTILISVAMMAFPTMRLDFSRTTEPLVSQLPSFLFSSGSFKHHTLPHVLRRTVQHGDIEWLIGSGSVLDPTD